MHTVNKTWFNHITYLIFKNQRQPCTCNFAPLSSRQQNEKLDVLAQQCSFPLYFQFYTCQAKAIIKSPTYLSFFIGIIIQFHPCWHLLFPGGCCIFFERLLDKNNLLFLCFIIGAVDMFLSSLKSCLSCNIKGRISI